MCDIVLYMLRHAMRLIKFYYRFIKKKKKAKCKLLVLTSIGHHEDFNIIDISSSGIDTDFTMFQ